MAMKEALKQYDKCQECAYVDDCPRRETVIMDAFRKNEIDVTCENHNEKENNSNEE